MASANPNITVVITENTSGVQSSNIAIVNSSITDLSVTGDVRLTGKLYENGSVLTADWAVTDATSNKFIANKPTGVMGPTGYTGPAGGNGATGAAGAQGPTGSAGLMGPTGAAGGTGALGPTGAAGATGSAGATGALGPTGVAGVQGIQGSTGFGTTGVAGPTGSAGSTGATGATGMPGPTGTISSVSSTYYYSVFTFNGQGGAGAAVGAFDFTILLENLVAVQSYPTGTNYIHSGLSWVAPVTGLWLITSTGFVNVGGGDLGNHTVYIIKNGNTSLANGGVTLGNTSGTDTGPCLIDQTQVNVTLNSPPYASYCASMSAVVFLTALDTLQFGSPTWLGGGWQACQRCYLLQRTA